MNIIVKAYNRPGYLRQVLTYLSKCKGIERHEVSVSVDNSPAIKLMHAVVEECKPLYRMSFKRVYYHEENLGCAGHTRFCVDEAFKDKGTAIHVEDDHIPAPDMISFFEACRPMYLEEQDLFAVCSFVRGREQKHMPEVHMDRLVKRDKFETGGAFMVTKERWDSTVTERLFGVLGVCARPEMGDEWLKGMRITDAGSWGWPLNKYWLHKAERTKHCLYPTVSRCQNIGALNGLFNPDPIWHKNHIYNDCWTGSKEYIERCSEERNYRLNESSS